MNKNISNPNNHRLDVFSILGIYAAPIGILSFGLASLYCSISAALAVARFLESNNFEQYLMVSVFLALHLYFVIPAYSKAIEKSRMVKKMEQILSFAKKHRLFVTSVFNNKEKSLTITSTGSDEASIHIMMMGNDIAIPAQQYIHSKISNKEVFMADTKYNGNLTTCEIFA